MTYNTPGETPPPDEGRDYTWSWIIGGVALVLLICLVAWLSGTGPMAITAR